MITEEEERQIRERMRAKYNHDDDYINDYIDRVKATRQRNADKAAAKSSEPLAYEVSLRVCQSHWEELKQAPVMAYVYNFHEIQHTAHCARLACPQLADVHFTASVTISDKGALPKKESSN